MATSGLINIGGGSSTPMTGATALLDGESGAVPTPLAGDETKVLSGAGTWIESPTTQVLTWGMNYWAATGSMTNAVSTIPYVGTSTRQTLAPVGQRLPLSSGTFTGVGITTDTTNNRLVITASGRYKISADITSGSAVANESGVQLIKNGTTILTMNTRLNNAAPGYMGSNLEWEGDLVATDFIELRAWVQSGTGTFYFDGGTFIVSQQPTAIAPIVNTVAEYGEVSITDSVTRLGTAFGDLSVNQTFTVPSAGTWRIGYQVSSTNGSSTIATTAFQLVDVTAGNIVVPNSSRFAIRAANGSNSQVSLSTIVTVSVPTTYKLQAATSNGTMAIDNTNNVVDGSGNSHFSYEKIAGQLPSTGTTVSYNQSTGSQGITTNVSPGDHAKFTIVSTNSGSDIILDTTTPYVNTANTASLGRFTLKANKTYKLSGGLGDIGYTTSSTSNYISYRWFNSDTNVALGQLVAVNSDYSELYDGQGGLAEAIFTPTVDTRVELRIVGNNNVSSYSGTLASGIINATIIQLGSSAITTTTKAIFRGYGGSLTTNGATQQVPITTESIDTTGSFASNVFTCPRTAYYKVHARGYFTGIYSISTEQSLSLRKNGTDYTKIFVEAYTAGTNELPLQFTDIVSCNAGDTLDLAVFGTNAQTFNLNSSYGVLVIEEMTTTY